MPQADYLICPKCGWLHLRPADFGANLDGVDVCSCLGCGGIVRPATEAEIAAVPPLVNVCLPIRDVPLRASKRFYAREGRGTVDVLDQHINCDDPKAVIMEYVPLKKAELLTEGRLRLITPMRDIDVVLNPEHLPEDARRWLRIVATGSPPEQMARDDEFLVEAARRFGGAVVVTVPAGWCAGDSKLHLANWFVERALDGAEEVVMRSHRIGADGGEFVPEPKVVLVVGKRG